MNLLITSSGRRTQLIKYFKNEFKSFGNIVVTDCDELAPTLYLADKYYVTEKITSKNYIKKLLEICKKEKIDGKKYAIKEAEMIVEDYISKIEKKEYEIGIGSKKIREKYKRLKALTIFLTIFSALSLWSILLR